MKIRYLIGMAAVLFQAGTAVLAGHKVDPKEFAFDSVQVGDWIPLEDSLLKLDGAVMLFEKVVVDDAAKKDYTTLVTIYRRIRIGSSVGKASADVTVPTYYTNQKVTFVLGRTIRHNGDTIQLAPEQVVEKEVFRTKGAKYKQVTFSMPGVSDDCIIEYAMKLQLPSTYGLWLIQKDIPLLHAELRWILSLTGDKSLFSFGFFSFGQNPNYVWLNMPHPLKLQKLPNIKEVKELVFSADSVDAFEKEEFALPENALKGQLRIYYGSSQSESAFWSTQAQFIGKFLSYYVADSKRIKKAAAECDSTKTVSEKAAWAFDWVRRSLRNVSYMKSDDTALKHAKYETADQALKSGFSDAVGINTIFCDLLRDMNIDAKLVWVTDRDEDILVREAKRWQFDHSIVAVPDSTDSWTFYSPGDMYVKSGEIAWYNEGISGLMEREGDPFVPVPFSPPSQNRTTRALQLTLDTALELQGTISERRTGDAARELRVAFHHASEAERKEEVKSSLTKILPGAEIDSILIENADSTEAPLKLNGHIKYSLAGTELPGGRILLKPFELLQSQTNPFVAQKRQNSIVMEFASETEEALTLNLPEGWKIEGVPPDSKMATAFGSCGVRFTSLGNSAQIQRVFTIDSPYARVDDYGTVQFLYEAMVGYNGYTITILPPGK